MLDEKLPDATYGVPRDSIKWHPWIGVDSSIAGDAACRQVKQGEDKY